MPTETNKTPSQGHAQNNHTDSHSHDHTAHDLAHNTATPLEALHNAAHAIKQHLPKVVEKAGKAAHLLEGVLEEDPKHGLAENLVCGTAKKAASGVFTGPMYAAAAAYGAAKAPPVPIAQGVGAAMAVLAVHPVINEAAKPVEKLVSQKCHVLAAWLTKIQHQASERAMNPVPPPQLPARFLPPPVPYQPPRSFSFSERSNLETSALLSLRTDPRYSQLSFSGKMAAEQSLRLSCAMSNCFGLSDFHGTLNITGLISSYNSYNISSIVRDALSTGEIGGVASQVAVIRDLINSKTHATAQEYFFCFSAENSKISPAIIQQITREIEQAYSQYNTLPFFSLHLNKTGALYPVIHPAYENTLVGDVISLLDYWMKGFLNGGTFNEKFLKLWDTQRTANQLINEADLRANLLDLKKYCKANTPGLEYISLRELESRYNLKSTANTASATYKQPFMTSFRIISFIEKIQRDDNILIPTPSFRVEYDIDPMPDYKEYLEQYKKEHGTYPEEYQNTLKAYQLFAEEIKETFPKLPFAQRYFELLGIITTLCHARLTFKEIGKIPVLKSMTSPPTPYRVPKAFPPLPLRHFQNYPMAISVGEVLKSLCSTLVLTHTVNSSCAYILSNDTASGFDTPFNKAIEATVIKLVQSKLPPSLVSTPGFEFNSDEIEKITKITTHFLYSQINQLRSHMHQVLNEHLNSPVVGPLNSTQKKAIKTLNLPQKIARLRTEIEQHFNDVHKTWSDAEELSTADILKQLPLSLHSKFSDTLLKTFKGVQATLQSQIATAQQAIVDQNNHKASQIASVPAHLRAINQQNINNFVSGVDQQIANIQTAINGAQLELSKIDSAIAASSNPFKSFSPNAQKSKITKLEGLRVLALIHEQNIKQLNHFEDSINHCSKKLLDVPKLMQHKLVSQYIHTMMHFTGPSFTSKTGETFKIVGGCGMNLPTLNTIPIEHAPQLSKALHSALATETHHLTPFKFNNKSYIAFRLPVRDCVSTLDHDESIPTALPEPSTPTPNSTPPLFHAIQQGDLEAVQNLIKIPADANHILPNGLFPLYVALQNKQEKIALWLLEVPNLSINEIIDNQMTALHLAIDSGASIVAHRLIEKNANCTLQRKSDGFTAVHCAAKKGNLQLLQAMQAKQVSLHTPLESGKTAIHIATEYGQTQCLTYLLSQNAAGANAKTIDGQTPLMLAIQAGQLEVALILAEVAGINAVNKQNQNASLLAMQNGMNAVADILMRRGEDPKKADTKGYNALYYLIRNGEVQRLQQLIQTGKISPDGSMLELAAKHGQFLIVYALLKMKVCITKNNQTSIICNAVHYDEIGYIRLVDDIKKLNLAPIAAKNASLRCLAFFINDLSFKDIEKQQLLKASFESKNPKAVDMILNRYSDINQPLDPDANTPLHYAVIQGSDTLVALLLDKGCDLKLRNKAGQTPFHIALAQDDPYLLKRLFKLSDPSQWPLDLFEQTKSATPSIKKVLLKHQKRLPSSVAASTPSSQAKPTGLPTIVMTPELSRGLGQLTEHFKNQNFYEATQLLEENPNLLCLFKAEQGSGLFKMLFQNIFYCEPDPEAESNEISSDQILLNFLKQKNINPIDYVGQHNVLLTILCLDEDSHDTAEYRLKMLSNYFPNSLSTLTMDSYDNTRMIELALKLNKISLFKALEQHSSQNGELQATPFFPLHEAIKANQYNLVEDLLERYPVNSINNKHQTPLMLAAAQNNVPLIELLLKRGADPDKTDIQGHNALHYAIMAKGNAAALCILPLLRDKNQPNRKGITPLCLAAANGLLPVVKMLCEQGDYAEVYDRKGKNALHYAAIAGQTEVIEYLVQHGFAINTPEAPTDDKYIARTYKRTPLQLAALSGKTAALRKLLDLTKPEQQEALLEQEDTQHNTVCEYAVLSKNAEMLETIQQLPLYHSPARNKTLLFSAIQKDHIPALSDLIVNDRSDATDESGMTALHMAALCNAGDSAALLMLNPDLALNSTDNKNCTPLHYAAWAGHVRLIELLCTKGAHIDYHNNSQPTALFLACEQGHLGAVVALIKHKADILIPNAQGLTPREIALSKGHLEIVEALKQAAPAPLKMHV